MFETQEKRPSSRVGNHLVIRKGDGSDLSLTEVPLLFPLLYRSRQWVVHLPSAVALEVVQSKRFVFVLAQRIILP